ncbi:MAG TPA: hypothetical protein VMW95_00085 [Desulfobacterales bacterium]|nr:hypothetical protein [Desulfobacterales bacterium]
MPVASRYKPPDSKLERRIITAMIISTNYLKQVHGIYRSESLKTKFTKTIAAWCIEYYEEYKEAPAKHIQDIFHSKTKQNFAADQVEDISDFLTEISEEYETSEQLNVEYLLRQTEAHFRLNVLDHIRVELGRAIISGDVEQGESIVKGFERTVRQQTEGIDIFRDRDAVISTFAEDQTGDKLIRFPGDLGNVIGDLEREYLMAFVGNTGVGKSWWMLQSGWWLTLAGYDVLYVSFEMSQAQVLTRTYQWSTGRPKRTGNILMPQWDCASNQTGECHYDYRTCKSQIITSKTGKFLSPDSYPSDYKPCQACKGDPKRKMDYEPASFIQPEKREGLDLERGIKMRNLFDRAQKRAGVFDFIRWPARQKSIDDLRLHLSNIEDYQGKVYDVIITDYASKMKPDQAYREKRFGIEEVFQDHKALAQEKHCLVITGHQGNTVRDDTDLSRGSWQESIAGLNELDVGVVINQKQQEKKKGWSEKSAGLYRLSMSKMRDEDFNPNAQVYCLSCLGIGRPYLDSYKK